MKLLFTLFCFVGLGVCQDISTGTTNQKSGTITIESEPTASKAINPVQVSGTLATLVTDKPIYIGAGLAFNQIGTPRWTGWVAGVYKVSNSVGGLYMATQADVIPVKSFDQTSGRNFYAFQTNFSQGLYKSLLPSDSGKFHLLFGGDAGVGLASSNPGMNLTFVGKVSVVSVFDINKRVSVVLPIRAVYLSPQVSGQSGSWNLIPQIGFLINLK